MHSKGKVPPHTISLVALGEKKKKKKEDTKPINESDQTTTLIKPVVLGCKALQKRKKQ